MASPDRSLGMSILWLYSLSKVILTWRVCERTETANIDTLNIIHVAGTKGVFIESFLRGHEQRTGFPRKTGLYTSPHLIFPEERIRINFQLIDRDLFAKYLFQVWDALTASGNANNDVLVILHLYFQLLALVSIHAFIKEGVDAAIFETHHGGECDATNVIEHPVATVITPLGLDHINQLGPNIESIAWHKAGIFKRGSIAISSPQGSPIVEEVLRNRAMQKGVKLYFVEIDTCLPDDAPQLKPKVQRINCSVALTIVQRFLQKTVPKNTKLSPSDIRKGIRQFSWPGKFQLIF
ncbi:Folylpolyglutamate synthase [Fusarium culmorum]|uniref:Folylpolyglutamate synthase n=1 Tax=Fusarium culmorum TaxID=5516 RepID=A0A2T4GW36_FUSCU|nr:Folylpolyglutamate synthase [Fusarium culmorum]